MPGFAMNMNHLKMIHWRRPGGVQALAGRKYSTGTSSCILVNRTEHTEILSNRNILCRAQLPRNIRGGVNRHHHPFHTSSLHHVPSGLWDTNSLRVIIMKQSRRTFVKYKNPSSYYINKYHRLAALLSRALGSPPRLFFNGEVFRSNPR